MDASGRLLSKATNAFILITLISFSGSISFCTDLFPNARQLPIMTSSSFLSEISPAGDQLRTFSGGFGAPRFVELISPRELVRYSKDNLSDQLEFQTHKGHANFTFRFEANQAMHKLILISITSQRLQKMYFASDSESFDEPSSESAAEVPRQECTTAPTTGEQVNSVFSILKSFPGCEQYDARFKSLSAPFATTPFADPVQVTCLRKQSNYQVVASDLNFIIQAKHVAKISCNAADPSNFDPNTNVFNLGKEILNGSEAQSEHVLFHELLHGAGIINEKEGEAAVACCLKPDSAASSCDLLKLFNKLRKNDGFSFTTATKFEAEILESKSLSTEQKAKIIDEIESRVTSLRLARCKDPKIFPKILPASQASLRALLNKNQRYVSTELQSKLQGLLTSDFADRSESMSLHNCKLDTRNANVNRLAGTAPADPSAAGQTSQSPITPPQLTYSPETTSVQVAKQEVEKVRAPLSAAREQARSVAKTFFAGAGSTAFAAQSTLPRQISKDQWTTTVHDVNPTTGAVTLDLGIDNQGRVITGSASIPFSGSDFGTADVVINHGERRPTTPAVSSTSSTGTLADDRSGLAPVVQGRNLKTGHSNETASSGQSESAQSNQDNSAADSRSINESNGGSGARALAASPSRFSGIPSSTTSASTSATTTSTLKRMFARAQKPAELIRRHLEDLKANSMMVRYGCVWYPQNFKGTQLFDLDAYQGRKCGPK
jgi:hypothetical protein